MIGFHLDVQIDFETSLIGSQHIEIDVNPGSFRRELSRARTFGFMKDVERLWAAGLALGASLENTVAIGDRHHQPAGLRYTEFVRHKALDAVGDLALAGAPILGAFRSSRGGHRLDASRAAGAISDTRSRTVVEAPRYREVRHAELSHRLAAANFAAEQELKRPSRSLAVALLLASDAVRRRRVLPAGNRGRTRDRAKKHHNQLVGWRKTALVSPAAI